MKRNFSYQGIDIFSGAGGLSIGAINAGIKVTHAIEKEPYTAKTFKSNHPNVEVITDDIGNINTSALKLKKTFIIFGGPPCQGFSTSNTKTRNNENKNNSLFIEFVRFVKELNPEWFLFENVEGISKFNKGKTVKEICSSFEKLGYKISFEILSAADYGVPQKRNRFIMVGNRIGIDFQFPKAENHFVTVAQAINDLPVLVNGQKEDTLPYRFKPSNYAKKLRGESQYALQNYVSRNQDYVINRYKYIKPGENWSAIPARLMKNYKNISNCHSGIYKRLDPKQPSIVISNYRKNMLIHPYQDRGLSVREAARIQSFPDSFIFEGPIMYIQQQIGNAVPPLLAEKIFKQIIGYYE